MSTSARAGCALIVAFSFAAAIAHAQNATPATAPAKPQCSVSDVPTGATAATPSAFPATAAPAATADKKSAAPALAEDVRKAIFIELLQIVARAEREARTAYPTGERAPMLTPTDVEKPGKLSGKRDTMAMSLERSYLSELLTRRSLACASARDIMREGRAAHWPAARP